MNVFNIIVVYSLGTIQGILIAIAVIYYEEKKALFSNKSGE